MALSCRPRRKVEAKFANLAAPRKTTGSGLAGGAPRGRRRGPRAVRATKTLSAADPSRAGRIAGRRSAGSSASTR